MSGGNKGEIVTEKTTKQIKQLTEQEKTICWDEMDFGCKEQSKCGICGCDQDGPDLMEFAWSDDGELLEDIICTVCEKNWAYDPDDNLYHAVDHGDEFHKENGEWRDLAEVREEIEESLEAGDDSWVADRVCENIVEIRKLEDENKKLKKEMEKLKEIDDARKEENKCLHKQVDANWKHISQLDKEIKRQAELEEAKSVQFLRAKGYQVFTPGALDLIQEVNYRGNLVTAMGQRCNDLELELYNKGRPAHQRRTHLPPTPFEQIVTGLEGRM